MPELYGKIEIEAFQRNWHEATRAGTRAPAQPSRSRQPGIIPLGRGVPAISDSSAALPSTAPSPCMKSRLRLPGIRGKGYLLNKVKVGFTRL